jgi:hypothetical protein
MRWRAVGMMTPFLAGQIDVGEFVYDATVPAMRASVYGLESGTVDLLITDQDTYILSGPHSAPNRCTASGRKLRVPSTQWLSSEAGLLRRNAGRKQIGAMVAISVARRISDVALVLDPRPPAVAQFVSREVVRSGRDRRLCHDNFTAFAPLSETDLPALRDMCAKGSEAARVKHLPDAPTTRELMAIRNEAAEAERTQRIKALIPGLSHDACARMTLPRWPE